MRLLSRTLFLEILANAVLGCVLFTFVLVLDLARPLFQFLVRDLAPIEVWATDEDCIPVRLRWDHLRQTYDLVELSGDPR